MRTKAKTRLKAKRRNMRKLWTGNITLSFPLIFNHSRCRSGPETGKRDRNFDPRLRIEVFVNLDKNSITGTQKTVEQEFLSIKGLERYLVNQGFRRVLDEVN
ncbi:hypothetical protein DEO72_LG3g2748 [Vigna unguiculata]|uniref:Uncharacterized protein n=1 Tax=Vigna unguiculata TaxID=3917 RepID=A0A4D6LIP7_VIGUN|nr:hypothetical protein DEO72_LG3g2742 [Vigna unguiculata]QCD88202.1 hypothetical protein DEO72_LG3g2744 [Vigna unguiculata]QCD88204.1 hypothetical protein DEO72_LG3g2746 [Vigna unguiculata]QCD88206.1 hypothetical protein DEO72_LG3g2748 [Vigna unguiculata]